MDPRIREVFFDVQRGLPRQGPGNDDSTRRALQLCRDLPAEPRILDIGCGPGMQTMALLAATAGQVVAVDTADEYLEQLRRRLQDAGLSQRAEVRNRDMAALNLPAGSFDLIWCEGAAYILGIRRALETWKPLPCDGGYLAFTELVWLEEDPPAEAAEFFGQEYPAMVDVRTIRQQIEASGYNRVGDFTIPDAAWWDDYYGPLAAKLPALKQKYAGDEAALGVVAMTESEIDMRRRFGRSYGYQFFVASKPG